VLQLRGLSLTYQAVTTLFVFGTNYSSYANYTLDGAVTATALLGCPAYCGDFGRCVVGPANASSSVCSCDCGWTGAANAARGPAALLSPPRASWTRVASSGLRSAAWASSLAAAAAARQAGRPWPLGPYLGPPPDSRARPCPPGPSPQPPLRTAAAAPCRGATAPWGPPLARPAPQRPPCRTPPPRRSPRRPAVAQTAVARAAARAAAAPPPAPCRP
jgi:hypothetical protein